MGHQIAQPAAQPGLGSTRLGPLSGPLWCFVVAPALLPVPHASALTARRGSPGRRSSAVPPCASGNGCCRRQGSRSMSHADRCWARDCSLRDPDRGSRGVARGGAPAGVSARTRAGRGSAGRATDREVGVVAAFLAAGSEKERPGASAFRTRPRSPTWRMRGPRSARRPPHSWSGPLLLGCQSRPTKQKRIPGYNDRHHEQCSQRAIESQEGRSNFEGPHVSQTHSLRRRRTQPAPRCG